ncbi:MAG: hypothetical protein Q8Q33_04435 [Chlamydiota bacterium]|nr:hypothetical protein [Chlamydiota bacterium]
MNLKVFVRYILVTQMLMLFLALGLTSEEEVPYRKSTRTDNEEKSDFMPSRQASVLVEHEIYMEEKQDAIERLRNGSSSTFSLLKKLRKEDDNQEESQYEKEKRNNEPIKRKDLKIPTEEDQEKKEELHQKYIKERKKEKEDESHEKYNLISLDLNYTEEEKAEAFEKKEETIDEKDLLALNKNFVQTGLEIDYRKEEIKDRYLMKAKSRIDQYKIREIRTPENIQEESELPFLRDLSLFIELPEDRI